MKDIEGFRYKYYENPVRLYSIDKFERMHRTFHDEDTRNYMYQVMATIGLELEARFNQVVFDNDKFILFGREKSKKSLSTKRKIHISEFNQKFKRALENNNNYVPTKVKPIYDFYAFKLVCPHIEDIDSIINRVTSDIQDPQMQAELEQKISIIKQQQQELLGIQSFLDSNSSIDISSLTYKEYYQKITYCYTILGKLAYPESYTEIENIEEKLEQVGQELEELRYAGKLNETIPSEVQNEYLENLQGLLADVDYKKSNKLDLSVGDLMIFDVLSTSEHLKKLGVSFSKNPERTKEKRTENGYVSNFYGLNVSIRKKNGRIRNLKVELQLQPIYRYEYGEHGPAAHHSMDKGIKERTLYQRPENLEDYKAWETKQFMALPRYFTYKGSGLVHIYNALDNFRRYYDCKDEKEVQQYVQFIAAHNVNLLYNRIDKFYLDDQPALTPTKEKTELEKER